MPQDTRSRLRTSAFVLATLVATLALPGCSANSDADLGPEPVRIAVPDDPQPIDDVARGAMQREKVNGMALAIIRGGEVAHVQAFGKRSVEQDLPLTPYTIMYGASLTKTAFAYTVLQLVDEGKLDLDASVADLLPQPLPSYGRDYSDLASDDRWRNLTPRIILTHSTGFANFPRFDPDGRLQFHFDPGARYSYSGEGFRILQLTVEENLGIDTGEEMQARVFDRFGMTDTSMVWRDRYAENYADTYDPDGALVPHDRRDEPDAAGSMDTSIADQARMFAGIVRGDGLTEASRAEMVRAQLPITSPHQFPTLDPTVDPRNAGIGLAAGLGVVTFEGPQGKVWFKGGHDDGTGNMAVCVEATRDCVVLLSNDVRAERIYPELVEAVLGDTGLPWRWEYQ